MEKVDHSLKRLGFSIDYSEELKKSFNCTVVWISLYIFMDIFDLILAGDFRLSLYESFLLFATDHLYHLNSLILLHFVFFIKQV